MEKEVLERLESLRIEMIDIAERKGLSHPDVLRISQEVDQLHNKLNLLGRKLPKTVKMKIMIREASMKSAYIYAKACV